MAKVTLQCPTCGGPVELGDIECPNCGMNLKSGESFETQVKKARGRGEHPEHVAAPIFIGVALLFAVALFSGLQYQKRAERAMQDRPDLFQPAVAELDKIDDLIYAKQYDKARERVQQLVKTLDSEAREIDVPQPFQKEKTSIYQQARERKEYNKKAVRSMLYSLRAKAESKLDEIPSS